MNHKNKFQKACIKLSLILFIALSTAFSLKAQTPLLRNPDIHNDNMVFVAGGDIWKVTSDGGIAQRLTFNDGEEQNPKFSNDGKLIAFTGEYDGNPDVYVMNADGGNIRRVSYHPGYDLVVGWHPEKNKIIFSSGRNSTTRYTKLFLISPDGTDLEELIMYDAAQGSFSPDASKIAYNKVSRENRTWKRYQGGLAQEVYIYDFETDEETNISNYTGTDRIPMWIGDIIYFTSDRDRVLNIFAYNTKNNQTQQITKHTEWDARFPSNDDKSIVYEQGGDIWKLDLASGNTGKIEVEIRADMEETRPYLKKADKEISSFDISPAGKRALVEARGEIFSVPQQNGATYNISQNSGARDRFATWSPDGKSIAYLSDESGEYQIYLVNPKGNSVAEKLTDFKDGFRHTLKWSPDSKNIAFTDQTLTLYILNVDSKKITKVDKANFENVDVSLTLKPIYDFSWSPDSRYISYSKMNENFIYQIYIYGLETNEIHNVSSGLFHDFNPVFTKNGQHVLFISNRIFSPTYCDIEWEMVYKNLAGIYALSLTSDSPSILPFRNDEVNGEDKTEPVNIPLEIDFDGIAGRIETLPLKKGNYRSLSANESTLYYLNAEEGDFNKFEFRGVEAMNLYAYDFETQKESTIVEGINSYKMSALGTHLIWKKGNEISLLKSGSTAESAAKLNLSGLSFRLDPKSEWKQIFNEVWRMERDYYYEPGMHGQDWDRMKVKYGSLIDRASCRQDVRYIIGELIGELNTSHTYIYGGDLQREADRVNVGMLGINFKPDTKSKRYQITKIFTESDWSREVYPPLAKPGLEVNEGDYILKVNGTEITSDKNFYSYFINLAGKQTTLTLNNLPSMEGAREIVVEPTRSESSMRYIDWLEWNRKTVEKASDGKIGYVYLPDTYNGSATDFPRYFYSQTKKEGFIVDGRFNGGGLDPEIFLQRLLKKPHGYWTRRNSEDQMIPALAVDAHMACLTNRYAGSGGDELPYEFRFNNMGPIIGTRTWGGLVGVSMFIDLIDGGGLTAPDYRIYNAKGEWVVENEGVTPDIIIDIDSRKMSEGYDTQLMKAVEVIMKAIQENPRAFPKHEAFPVDR
ncbi:MAG: PDZ domain-containing protein [Bacteroidales bacterium]|nr:PDZ domain-containing protein [Bacteroidales bacterium]